MTAAAKNELGTVESTTACCRQAEVVTLVRFAGELQAMTGRVIVTAELDTGAVARRLRATIHELYGHPADVRVLTTDHRTSTRYLLRVLTKGWAELVASPTHPLSKDAVAGRLRRLLGLADRTARETGTPVTSCAILADLAPGP